MVFTDVLKRELARLDKAAAAKRVERIIDGYVHGEGSPRALIDGNEYVLFNANDYLGLRHHQALAEAEHAATKSFGVGPGGVRFICGTLAVHRELERALARFHGRDDALLFSSGFAANFGVLHALIKGQSKDSLVSADTLVISDALNHRSIIDGVRVTGLPKEQRVIFPHLDLDALDALLAEHAGKHARVVVVTDGVFSMLGEHQDLARLREVVERHAAAYEEGVLTVVDDAHGVAAFGATGRGTEEVTGAQCDVLVATMGKGFGTDGGYVVGDQAVIDYLRESAATYIYSNPVAPGTAGAALAAVQLIGAPEGKRLLARLAENIALFKRLAGDAGLALAADSVHPVQPVLARDAATARRVVQELFEQGFLVTAITYPIVPKGRDEIRVQLSATHTGREIASFVTALGDALGPHS